MSEIKSLLLVIELMSNKSAAYSSNDSSLPLLELPLLIALAFVEDTGMDSGNNYL